MLAKEELSTCQKSLVLLPQVGETKLIDSYAQARGWARDGEEKGCVEALLGAIGTQIQEKPGGL